MSTPAPSQSGTTRKHRSRFKLADLPEGTRLIAFYLKAAYADPSFVGPITSVDIVSVAAADAKIVLADVPVLAIEGDYDCPEAAVLLLQVTPDQIEKLDSVANAARMILRSSPNAKRPMVLGSLPLGCSDRDSTVSCSAKDFGLRWLGTTSWGPTAPIAR
jgi:hypothetical protein